jgi:cytochrome c oxidase subunit 4
MSDHAVAEHDGPGAGDSHAAAGHAHPGPAEYIRIGIILFILTVIEVAIVYLPALAAILVPLLMVLMVVKFAMVVLWFMHLKFDARLFSTLFVFPLLVAVCIILALIALFSIYPIPVAGGH